jgi:hypothetical protein
VLKSEAKAKKFYIVARYLHLELALVALLENWLEKKDGSWTLGPYTNWKPRITWQLFLHILLGIYKHVFVLKSLLMTFQETTN